MCQGDKKHTKEQKIDQGHRWVFNTGGAWASYKTCNTSGQRFLTWVRLKHATRLNILCIITTLNYTCSQCEINKHTAIRREQLR